jgi:UDP-N-acetylmuramoyl-L-alanyl-D-glutamate--2,6-diaminopimelate ligase
MGLEKMNTELVANILSAKDIKKLMKDAKKENADIVVLEISLTLVLQDAFKGIYFDTVVLTNIADNELASEQLSVEDYAKKIFEPVRMIKEEGLAVVNGDDTSKGFVIKAASDIPQAIYALWCSTNEVDELEVSLDSIKCKFDGAFYQTSLGTEINVMNMLQAIRTCMKYTGTDNIDRALLSFTGVSGRIHTLQSRPIPVIIDYAYQPSVIKQVLNELKKYVGNRKLIAVLGMNGKSHVSRSKCALYACHDATAVMLAAQDGRGEEIYTLNTTLAKEAESMNGVLVDRVATHAEYLGLDKGNLKDKLYRVIENNDIPLVAFDESAPSSRYDAITFALDFASPGDMVVIFGKGNDTTLDIGKVIYEWNDVEMTRSILQG